MVATPLCSVLHVSPLEPELYITLVAVLDPLSPDTQRFAPILQTLHAAFSTDMTVYLNPRSKLSQMPVSRSVMVLLKGHQSTVTVSSNAAFIVMFWHLS